MSAAERNRQVLHGLLVPGHGRAGQAGPGLEAEPAVGENRSELTQQPGVLEIEPPGARRERPAIGSVGAAGHRVEITVQSVLGHLRGPVQPRKSGPFREHSQPEIDGGDASHVGGPPTHDPCGDHAGVGGLSEDHQGFADGEGPPLGDVVEAKLTLGHRARGDDRGQVPGAVTESALSHFRW
jgi:hypothetical protein